MSTPPFRTAALVAAWSGLASDSTACCGHGHGAVPAPARRARLADLDPHLHCSVIGTCLGSAELRRLLPRWTAIDAASASELDVHHAAVALAGEGGAGAKALHKLLDTRHAPALQRWRSARSDAELRRLWTDAMRSGDVPGAYWAILTHPLTTIELRQFAFGEVHMLSHLVGAANRADIRRLVALERHNAALQDQVERQQARLRELAVERHETVRRLSSELVELTSRLKRESTGGPAALVAELAVLRQAVHTKDQQLALHTSRREEAERTAALARAESLRLGAELDSATRLIHALQIELGALEREVAADPESDEATRLAPLAGRRLLYVGGRPSSNKPIQQLCERAGITLHVHDGGLEDRKGQLRAAIPGTDLVLFPADCVDHDSVANLKRLCARHGVAYQPLRTAALASFVAAAVDHARRLPLAGDLPRLCLRHG